MNITELVQSPRWKKFMAFVYGWGAAVVLIGALFKIQHYPGAGYMLVIGMGTEVVIFFFSAFEPPHEEPDWSLVYPELIGLEPHERVGSTKVEGLDELQNLLKNISVNPETLSSLGEGLAKLNQTTQKLADLSNATLATENYVQNVNSASEAIGKFSSHYTNSCEQLSESAQQLQQSYSKTASLLEDSGKNVAQQINQSGETIVESYSQLSNSLEQDSKNVADNSSNYNKKLEELNKNLSSLNSVYELQLNHTNDQLKNTQETHSQLNKIMDNLSTSLNNSEQYQKETQQLNQNLEALNTIYGNMLSAMDLNKKRG